MDLKRINFFKLELILGVLSVLSFQLHFDNLSSSVSLGERFFIIMNKLIILHKQPVKRG